MVPPGAGGSHLVLQGTRPDADSARAQVHSSRVSVGGQHLSGGGETAPTKVELTSRAW